MAITLERMPLWKDADPSIDLTRYVRDDQVERPAMLVVPGGGYGGVCRPHEGVPIADYFASLGFQAFILNYRVFPHRFPEPQKDILRAIKLIRANAEAWHVKKDNVAAVGFSAGGHLCASAGTLFNEIDASAGDEADLESGRPDAMVLSYPVISFGPYAHMRSGQVLLGDDFEEKRHYYSLENRVTSDTPPSYIWHTIEDEIVPVENSFLFANALIKAKVPCELRIVPFGNHGRQMGYGNENIAGWPERAKNFLIKACNFKFPDISLEKAVILTFDDACKSHLEVAAPLLQKYGFHATFFITRFSEEWREKNEPALLTAADVKKLSDMGFEIGNHTLTHPNLAALDEDTITDEICKLNYFLLEAGVPLPTSFAYPGGPFCELAAEILPRHGFKYARTAERKAWEVNPAAELDMNVPAIPIQKEDTSLFYDALKLVEPGKPVVLIFHGVPDPVHAHVNTPASLFTEYMEYLHENGYSVYSMGDIKKLS